MKTGIEMIPSISEILRKSSKIMSAWILIQGQWDSMDLKTKNDVLKYSKWCNCQGGDVTNAVRCAFIEHLVEDKNNWSIFRNHYSYDDIMDLMPLWEYNHKTEARSFALKLAGRI